MSLRQALMLAVLPILGGCASVVPQPGGQPPRPVTRAPATAPATDPVAQRPGFIAPTVMQLRGLEGVIGQGVSALVRQFGEPRLRVPESDALKLQWTGQPCVLDVYLYPLRPGAEPVATHVEARRASDAAEVDRAGCVAALRR